MADVRLDWSTATVDSFHGGLTVFSTEGADAVWEDQARRIVESLKAEAGRPGFVQGLAVQGHPRVGFSVRPVDEGEEEAIKRFLNELVARVNHNVAAARAAIEPRHEQDRARAKADQEGAERMEDRFRE